MTVEIMQGDSYAIFIDLMQDGGALTPSMIDDLEVQISNQFSFYFSDGTVKYDAASGRWYIWPTQEQTFSMEEGSHKVEIRVRYRNQNTTNVQGYTLEDKIKVKSAASREVL